jgi:hypothetical protein
MTRGPKRQRASLQAHNQKIVKLAWQGFKPKPWRKRCQRPICKCTQIRDHAGSNRGGSRGRTGPKWAWFTIPFYPRCMSINCLYLCRPPHPSIHQRAAETKEKHQEEAVGRREFSSCLGDGLGHALAAMVGPAWWSQGGVPVPRLEFVKSFVPSTFGDVISCHTLIYYELCLFICVATICL